MNKTGHVLGHESKFWEIDFEENTHTQLLHLKGHKQQYCVTYTLQPWTLHLCSLLFADTML